MFEVAKASAMNAVPMVNTIPTTIPNKRFMAALLIQLCDTENAFLASHVPSARWMLALLKSVRLMMARTSRVILTLSR